jgi:hypothetical protein
MTKQHHTQTAAVSAVQNQSACRLSSRPSRRSPTSALFPKPIRYIFRRNTVSAQQRITQYQSRKRERSGCLFVDIAESRRSDPELFRGAGVKVKFAGGFDWLGGIWGLWGDMDMCRYMCTGMYIPFLRMKSHTALSRW